MSWEHGRRGPGRGLGAGELPARSVRPVRSRVASVQLARLSHRSVLMVGEGLRFDSVTGLQVIDSFSNGLDERRGPSPGDPLQLSLHRKLPLHSEGPGQLLKAAVDG